MSETLTPREAAELARLERIVEAGLETAVATGRALLAIHQQRLYRGQDRTWESYCRTRWDMSARHADRLIKFAGIMADLGCDEEVEEDETRPCGLMPDGEYVARSLGPLEPQQRREVWEAATAEAYPAAPTPARVQEIARVALAGLSVEQQVRILTEQEESLAARTAPLEPSDENTRLRERMLRNLTKAAKAARKHPNGAEVLALIDRALVLAEDL